MHLLYEFGFAMLRRYSLRTEDEDKQWNKLDRMIRDSGPMDQDAVPNWMSSFEIKKASGSE